MTQETPPVIEITGLHKSYGALEVLKGVDMAARAGDVVSLIGSSGSGKSTLLRCANLLEDSQEGEIRFEGEAVRWKGTGHNRRPADAGQVRRIRTNLSMVFQQFNLWAHMSILQNVMEAPVTVLGEDRAEVEARARKLLDKVGIGDKCDVWPAMSAPMWYSCTRARSRKKVRPTRFLAPPRPSACNNSSAIPFRPEDEPNQIRESQT